ncbi:MAG: uracil-DNA glycosylase [Longimicrobiales bacterium]|nr:uracil-DNA glycosylase [Longimicrobiales bacterium]
MNERDRLAGVLQQLRELGLSEVYLDELTADEAVGLLSEFPGRRSAPGPSPKPAAGPAASGREPGEGGSPEATGTTRRLEVLSNEASGCVKCRLSEGRTQVVFGRGSADAELVVVGEAPGREEDRTGLPFVGPAGKLLDLLLLSVGIERGSAYICNVLKCRPPNNRDPMADEVDTCAPYLHAQLDIIQPRVLLAVGKFAGQWLSGREQSVGRLRGTVHQYRGVPVVATYHPAYLLRSPHATRKTWQDLQLMRQVLDEHT